MNNDNRFICALMEKSNSIISTSLSSNLNESDSSTDTLQDITNLSSSEDLLLFPLMKFLTSGQRRYRIQNYLQIIDFWSDQEFKEHLKINRCTASKLIGIIMNICIFNYNS